MPVSKEHTIAIPADPVDPEDRAVSSVGLERGLMGRSIRQLRNRLGLSPAAFAARYGIPIANIRQYESGAPCPRPRQSFLNERVDVALDLDVR